jgi:hypothetical protein
MQKTGQDGLVEQVKEGAILERHWPQRKTRLSIGDKSLNTQ